MHQIVSPADIMILKNENLGPWKAARDARENGLSLLP
jgi:hypothetical protein